MKERYKFLLILIAIIFIAGCGKETGKFENISVEEYKRMIENKESFVLEMMSSDCTHCKSLKPKLQSVIKKYGITIKTINLEKLSRDEYQEFTKLVGTTSTPTVFFYKEGYETSVTTRIEGDIPTERIIQKMKDNGIITE